MHSQQVLDEAYMHFTLSALDDIVDIYGWEKVLAYMREDRVYQLRKCF